MKLLLEGKSVAENIKSGFEKRIENLEKKPNIAVLGIKGDEASLTYIKSCLLYTSDAADEL